MRFDGPRRAEIASVVASPPTEAAEPVPAVRGVGEDGGAVTLGPTKGADMKGRTVVRACLADAVQGRWFAEVEVVQRGTCARGMVEYEARLCRPGGRVLHRSTFLRRAAVTSKYALLLDALPRFRRLAGRLGGGVAR